MIRSALLGLVLLTPLSTEALAQAVTRPTVTASAGYLRNEAFYDGQGETAEGSTTTSVSLRLGAEAPVYRRDAVTVSAGGRIAVSSFELSGRPGSLRLQNLDLYGRVGTPQASARLGVSLDLGRSPYDGSNYNTDGQNAVVGQLRGEVPAGPAILFAQADGALVLSTTQDLAITTADPFEPPTLVPTSFNDGNVYGLQVGASVGAGPARIGLAVFYAARGEGAYETLVPPPTNLGFDIPARGTYQNGYREAVGVIPSVEYRAPSGRLSVRAEGSFSDYLVMENVPVGITISGKDGPITRPAVTVSVDVGL